ncbi:MAG: MFS transporter [Spirochaetaceae bacterium]|nr:MAG: MFS transporter [Spirochaetaceae bacterium]
MKTPREQTLAERPHRLPVGLKLGFGIADLGGNLFFTMMGFYLLAFLTDSFGIAAGAAGTALFIGKVWDAVTDPAVGHISDRTRTRWGRRRPYMAVGAILLFVSMILMFMNPSIGGQTARFIWVTVVYCFVNTAYTLVNIPYGSLTPELTSDFDERTSLNGYRMSFAVVGTLVGAGAVLPLVAAFGGGDAGWTATGAVMGALMAVVTLITVLTVKEKRVSERAPKVNVFKSYIEVLGMKTFLTALVPYALHIAGVTVIQASLIYFFRYVYGDEAQFTFALMFLLVVSLIFIPIWVRVSKSIGKRLSYNIGMLIFAGAVLLFFAIGASLPVWFSFVIFAIAGTGFATNYVMPFSMIPDVIEYDFAENGTRREGIFYGMWTFVSKIGQAFALALSGWVLALFGYIAPTAAVPDPVQGDLTVLGIRLLTGPVPALFFIAGVIVLSYYPITHEKYQEILAKSQARSQAQTG